MAALQLRPPENLHEVPQGGRGGVSRQRYGRCWAEVGGAGCDPHPSRASGWLVMRAQGQAWGAPGRQLCALYLAAAPPSSALSVYRPGAACGHRRSTACTAGVGGGELWVGSRGGSGPGEEPCSLSWENREGEEHTVAPGRALVPVGSEEEAGPACGGWSWQSSAIGRQEPAAPTSVGLGSTCVRGRCDALAQVSALVVEQRLHLRRQKHVRESPPRLPAAAGRHGALPDRARHDAQPR